MKSVCVTKAYYIIADGYTECYTFNSREEAESFNDSGSECVHKLYNEWLYYKRRRGIKNAR